jgi:hypothetical protein
VLPGDLVSGADVQCEALYWLSDCLPEGSSLASTTGCSNIYLLELIRTFLSNMPTLNQLDETNFLCQNQNT